MPNLLGSWDPMIMGMLWNLEVVPPLGDCGAVQCVRNQGRPAPIRKNLSLSAPAHTGPSWLFWNRCCVPLTSDPKILGVLGCLWHGESSGDPGTILHVHVQGGAGLAPTGTNSRRWLGRFPVSLFLLTQAPPGCFGIDIAFHSPVIPRSWVC